jgi:hypothetical protein
VEPWDNEGAERLAQYIVRVPFLQERMTYIPEHEFPDGVAKVVYEGKTSGVDETFTTLDWAGRRHVVRYYGYYSNKSRGMRKKENNDDNAKSELVTVESDISRKKFRKNRCGLSGKYIMSTHFYVQNVATRCELFRSLRMMLQ